MVSAVGSVLICLVVHDLIVNMSRPCAVSFDCRGVCADLAFVISAC